MATTQIIRPIGPTYALSVAGTQHAALAIPASGNDVSNYAAFVNTGTVVVCACVAPLPATGTAATPTLVFPVEGTPTVPTAFMLPALMVDPLVVAVPANGFSVSAIGASSGPSIIYVTPVGDQG